MVTINECIIPIAIIMTHDRTNHMEIGTVNATMAARILILILDQAPFRVDFT